MSFIFAGSLAFICFAIFDLNKIRFISKNMNILVVLGSFILAFSTMAIIISPHSIRISTLWQWLALILAILVLLLMIYTIFGAVSFKKTYLETQKGNTVVTTGMYALCRHPGVLWFFLFYCLSGLAFNNQLLLIAAIIWTLLDIVYVYIQDRWIFPIILEDYHIYQQQVPFIIPNLTSLQHSLASLLGKGD
ncbi:MAG TPA: hypothetical protein PLC88_03360 [Syntrophomonas sp.]|nr:hypothetical protein [Syntrophomonas sp.]HRW11496.1 hypothetical protein [Syntrophomonas sp.]